MSRAHRAVVALVVGCTVLSVPLDEGLNASLFPSGSSLDRR